MKYNHVGTCGNQSLDIPGTMPAVTGMTYDLVNSTWYFAVNMVNVSSLLLVMHCLFHNPSLLCPSFSLQHMERIV